MPDPKSIADAYLASWNATPEERPSALAAWSPEAVYADPLMTGAGRDGIAAMIDRAVAQFPGHRFALAGTPDGHGAFVRFGWTLSPQSGPAAAAGTDVIRLDDDGLIAEVIGFLDAGAGMSAPFVPIGDGQRLHVSDWGDGQPIVFLAG